MKNYCNYFKLFKISIGSKGKQKTDNYTYITIKKTNIHLIIL